MSFVSTAEKHSPVLDESSFQQLLAAAYVVQQHNDGLRSRDPAQATSDVLTEIAEIQLLVRSGSLDLHTGAVLTAERLQKITRSDGVRIELFSDPAFECLAECGAHVTAAVATHSRVLIEHLKHGELFQSRDAKSDIRLGSNLPRELSVRTVIAAPILSLAGFAGFIEVQWERPNASQESDARACSLMAGLISGILGRSARIQEKEVCGKERDDDRIKLAHFRSALPSDNLLVHDSTQHDPALLDDTNEANLSRAVNEAAEVRRPAQNLAGPQPEIKTEEQPSCCRVCGRPFRSEEAFCGTCSMPRVAGTPSENLQGKWASLWYMQQARAAESRTQASLTEPKALEIPAQTSEIPAPTVDSLAVAQPSSLPSMATLSAKPAARRCPLPDAKPNSELVTKHNQSEELDPTDDIPFPTQVPPVTTNNHTTTQQAVGPSQPELLQRMWNAVWLRVRGRSITWAVTAAGLVLLLLVLAVWPSAKYPQLTWFQSMLVQLGLADVPAHPSVSVGNPAAHVWVDVHTGLYYCNGSDLFGKTAGGYLATQRDAQDNQFEAAARLPCQ